MPQTLTGNAMDLTWRRSTADTWWLTNPKTIWTDSQRIDFMNLIVIYDGQDPDLVILCDHSSGSFLGTRLQWYKNLHWGTGACCRIPGTAHASLTPAFWEALEITGPKETRGREGLTQSKIWSAWSESRYSLVEVRACDGFYISFDLPKKAQRFVIEALLA